ncbi:mechanosensitive ion channel [Hahella aquimaris]|uniref:mechanosensitive ion channel family protein n=1 Tax=Hahella sp. HNIBRBA332 TaxID=3015983 RepID=UPI00273C6413|nr:mechanosensitive ion channel domain-containing protein [Hahella sp. HNIBRBA332]WLQ12462.1 mechanosensitive ion channel [Hahella sp. HNIBRBA332]
MENLDQYLDKAVELVMEYAPQLLLAIITLAVGMWLINKALKFTDDRLQKKFDPTLTKFVHSLASVALKAMLLVSVAQMVGIETTSFIAVLGAAGLAIGLALQGNLSNFASGIMILVFKPFKVGDVIDGAGYIGTVREIQIFTTILMTPDNRRVIIPNSNLANNPLINIAAEATRRVDMVFGISYGDDIDKAKNIIKSMLEADSRVLKDPAPVIAVLALADSSVNLAVRPWVATADYWQLYFDMHENVKKRFDEEGITIPFPQRDVHIYQETQ